MVAFWNAVHANEVASAGSVLSLNNYVAACFATDRLGIEVDDAASWWLPRWSIDGDRRSRLLIGRILHGQRREQLPWRIFDIMPMLADYLQQNQLPPGEVIINLEDYGLTPGLAFCDHRDNYFLIPDPLFMSSRGYADLRRGFANPMVWPDRKPIAFWRGTDFGPIVKSMDELPRVQLCRIAAEHPGLFDVGFSGVRNSRFTNEISASSFVREHVPAQDTDRYRIRSTSTGAQTPGPDYSRSCFQAVLSSRSRHQPDSGSGTTDGSSRGSIMYL
jgi:hypothetical protein